MARTLLTTEGLVADQPAKKQPGMAGGGMSGMPRRRHVLSQRLINKNPQVPKGLGVVLDIR